MKTKYLFVVLTSLVCAGIVFSVLKTEKKTLRKSLAFTFKESKKENIKGAIEWWAQRLVNHLTGTIDPADVRKAEEQVLALRKLKNTSEIDMTWIEMGPDNVGGRTRALLIDKDNYNIIYSGGVSGGLWRSTTGGLSWNKVLYTGDENSLFQNLCIVSICQAANGDIYFGTGEREGSGSRTGQGIWKSTKATDPNHNNFERLDTTWAENNQSTFNFVNRLAADPVDPQKIYAATSKGIMITRDGGVSWKKAAQTLSNESKDVKVGPDGTVLCDIGNKIYISTDTGATFNLSLQWSASAHVGRIELAISPSDPNYMYCQASTNSAYGSMLLNIYQSKDKGATWTVIGPGVGPNNEYIDFNPLGNQGTYDNVIAVFPDNPGRIFVGGQIYMWTWSEEDPAWSKVSSPYSGFCYVHADQHVIIFHPDYADNHTIYVGTDGGIYVTTDDAFSFSDLNRNYNTVQFYAMGFDGKGRVVGGTQDNGTQYIGFTGNTLLNATDIKGGDGGYSEMGVLDPNATFATTYYGALKRSNEKGKDFEDVDNPVGKYFFSERMLNKYWGGLESNIANIDGGYGYNIASFVTPIRLWESFYDVQTPDSVTYINEVTDMVLFEWTAYYNDFLSHYENVGWDTVNYTLYNVVFDTTMLKNASGDYIVSTQLIYAPGQEINAKSEIYSEQNKKYLPYELTDYLFPGDSVRVQDVYQSVLAIGLNGNVWITRKPLNFKLMASEVPWFPIVKPGVGVGVVQTMEFSADGNYLFFSDDGFNLFRAKDILYARDDSAMAASFYDGGTDVANPEQVIDVKLIETFGNFITSIASDPNDPGNLVVTLGEYGSTDYVMYSTNAILSNPTFTSIQGDLPEMPVYSSVINWDVLKPYVLIGTQYGVYITYAINGNSTSWVDQNINGMMNVQVMQLRQQIFGNNGISGSQAIINHGYIYAATHGRGIYRSETFKGPLVGIYETPVANSKPSIQVYPNPVKDIAHVNYNLIKKSDITINVYDLQGKLVRDVRLAAQKPGRQIFDIELKGLAKGSYILNISTAFDTASSKFLIQ